MDWEDSVPCHQIPNDSVISDLVRLEQIQAHPHLNALTMDLDIMLHGQQSHINALNIDWDDMGRGQQQQQTQSTEY